MVFIAFLDNILVLGNMRKYIKLFCGIILIFIILQPVSYIFGEDFDISKALDLSEFEDKVQELSEELEMQDTVITKIEDKVQSIVNAYGFELTYILIIPDEEDSNVTEGIQLTIEKKNKEIVIDKIAIGEEETKDNEEIYEEMVKEIATQCGVSESGVIVNIE